MLLTLLAKSSTPSLACFTKSLAPSPAEDANSASLTRADSTAALSLDCALSIAPCSCPYIALLMAAVAEAYLSAAALVALSYVPVEVPQMASEIAIWAEDAASAMEL